MFVFSFFFLANENDDEFFMVQVTSGDECWLLQRNLENFKLLDAQLHQCIYDRKISQLEDLSDVTLDDGDIEVRTYALFLKQKKKTNNLCSLTFKRNFCFKNVR